MKKYVYAILVLSIAGAALSGMLLLQHYYPDSGPGSLFCGGGLVNSCLTLSQSSYSTLFGVPLAVFGLLWHLTAIFMLLIADYAQGRYYAYSLAILLPLACAAVGADIFLGAILVAIGLYCALCIATYGVNLAILAVLILWSMKDRATGEFSLAGSYREIFTDREASPDRKAFYASFILFMFLLAFALFSTSHIMRLKTERQSMPPEKVEAILREFYRTPGQNITFPESRIALGDAGAPLTVTVFTDFLCSACYEFYRIEKFLLSKYRGRIRIVYFNYPLDGECNPDVKRTLYANSCLASRAFIAASGAGILDSYIVSHFADYRRIHGGYSREMALEAFSKSGKDGGGMDEKRFTAMMNSEETTELLGRDMALAKELGVQATPTLFIGGRKMEGVPPLEILDLMISRELSGR